MKVLITGATGMIGQEIVALCHQSNIDVHYLTTNKKSIQEQKNYKGFLWNPKLGKIDPKCLEGVEVIINLVGATVAKRWTTSYKKEILESRTVTASLLFNTIKSTPNHRVKHIVSASAIGVYPDSFQNYYMEDAQEKETNFLGSVVQQWEAAIKDFEVLQIKTSILRIGLVLSSEGGAYPKIEQPIRYGVGACFGNGKQWQSWIHIDDVAAMFMHVMKNQLTGVFNAVAPNPVSNKKMTDTIADCLQKKIWLPGIPKFFMRIVLGEMHTLLYASHRVCSNRISNSGFVFRYDNIHTAISKLTTSLH